MKDESPDIPTPLSNCPCCGYSLAELPAEHTCPECGFAYDPFSFASGFSVEPENRRKTYAPIVAPVALLLIIVGGTILKGDVSIGIAIFVLLWAISIPAAIIFRRFIGGLHFRLAVNRAGFEFTSSMGAGKRIPWSKVKRVTWSRVGGDVIFWGNGTHQVMRCGCATFGGTKESRKAVERIHVAARAYGVPLLSDKDAARDAQHD